MPMSRLFAGTWVTSALSTNTLPASGRSKPPRIRSAVVLPQPEGPSRATSSPDLSISEVEASGADADRHRAGYVALARLLDYESNHQITRTDVAPRRRGEEGEHEQQQEDEQQADQRQRHRDPRRVVLRANWIISTGKVSVAAGSVCDHDLAEAQRDRQEDARQARPSGRWEGSPARALRTRRAEVAGRVDEGVEIDRSDAGVDRAVGERHRKDDVDRRQGRQRMVEQERDHPWAARALELPIPAAITTGGTTIGRIVTPSMSSVSCRKPQPHQHDRRDHQHDNDDRGDPRDLKRGQQGVAEVAVGDDLRVVIEAVLAVVLERLNLNAASSGTRKKIAASTKIVTRQ